MVLMGITAVSADAKVNTSFAALMFESSPVVFETNAAAEVSWLA